MNFKELMEKVGNINSFDLPILGGADIKIVHIYFNRLHKQIKFLKDIAKYGFVNDAKIVVYHLYDAGSGVIFMTLAKNNDEMEEGISITKNSNKDTPMSHVSCLSTTKNFFEELDIAIQPKSNKKRKDGSFGEKGFYVKGYYRTDVLIKDEKREGFILDMEPWQNKLEYAPSANPDLISKKILEKV
jgi:hypothetical protein